jgi:2-polyprenyl-6-methoxyphenol hydroxylase-like FAD-dependent oxidoreductase
MPTPIPTASKSSGRALVIGGSLAGLFAGLLLRRGGFDVDIYERVHGALAGRGAGIVTHAMLEETLDAAGIAWHEDLGVDVATRRVYDLAGRLVLEWPYPQILTAWDRLYDMLRRAFPSERYHDGKELASIETGTQRVTARFADGSTAEGDLLIGADGLRSTVRGQLLPDIVPLYVGYAAWRALVPEAAIPRPLHAELFMHMAFCLPPGEQILGYPVAGPGNDLRPGHRRYNLVWYRPAEPQRALKRLLTDESGVTHALSIPPPLISREVIAEMRAAAETVLAPASRSCRRSTTSSRRAWRSAASPSSATPLSSRARMSGRASPRRRRMRSFSRARCQVHHRSRRGSPRWKRAASLSAGASSRAHASSAPACSRPTRRRRRRATPPASAPRTQRCGRPRRWSF